MIGENIRKIREKLGMTQVDFAQSILVKQAAISKYELNITKPSWEVAKRIVELAKSKKIKITLNDIFTE